MRVGVSSSGFADTWHQLDVEIDTGARADVSALSTEGLKQQTQQEAHPAPDPGFQHQGEPPLSHVRELLKKMEGACPRTTGGHVKTGAPKGQIWDDLSSDTESAVGYSPQNRS